MQNKKLRKALAVSMAIAMTGGLLAGCGSNNSSSSNGGAAKSGSTSSASGELDTSEFVELIDESDEESCVQVREGKMSGAEYLMVGAVANG